MAGVVRTIPSHSTRSASRAVKAPRPPNAWIIYRSDKVHQLPPVEAGQPRRAQAEVSKMISNMWANESEETRQEYERRAEEAKAAHALKYPGYRFKPMKKEEKRAQKEQEQNERLAKRRDCRSGPGTTPDRLSVPPNSHLTASLPQYYASINMPINLQHFGLGPPHALPYPFMSYHSPQTRFGPAGPTPPVSAAASPNNSSSSPPPLSSTDESSSPASTPDQKTDASSSGDIQSKFSTPSASSPAATTSSSGSVVDVPVFPTFNSATFANGQEWTHATSITLTDGGTLTPSTLWQEVESNQQQTSQEASTTAQIVATENVSFDFEPYQLLNLDNLLSGSTDDTLSAFVNGSGIFNLSNLDTDRLSADPTGEIEISLGEPLDLTVFPPELFNLDAFNVPTVSAEYYIPPPIPTVALDGTGGHHSTTSSMAYDPDDYLDFGLSSNFGETHDIPTLAAGVNAEGHFEPDIMTTGAYVPPTGAANSSFRRVGGSWTKQFAKGQTPSPPRTAGMTQSQ